MDDLINYMQRTGLYRHMDSEIRTMTRDYGVGVVENRVKDFDHIIESLYFGCITSHVDNIGCKSRYALLVPRWVKKHYSLDLVVSDRRIPIEIGNPIVFDNTLPHCVVYRHSDVSTLLKDDRHKYGLVMTENDYCKMTGIKRNDPYKVLCKAMSVFVQKDELHLLKRDDVTTLL